MSRKFKVPVGLVALASNPATGSTGDAYYNTVEKTIYTYDGTVWAAATNLTNLDGGTPTETYSGVSGLDGGTP